MTLRDLREGKGKDSKYEKSAEAELPEELPAELPSLDNVPAAALGGEDAPQEDYQVTEE